MKKFFTCFVALLAIAAAATGLARAQNASPDVTLDFTTNSWGIPEGSTNKTYAENSYTSDDYTITLKGGGSSSNGYYFHNNGYLLLGKSGAYLQLPEFESAVDSIQVVGTSGASTDVVQNIYVGETEVSTQTAGMKDVTQTYVIDESYRAAGNSYTLKVGSNHNTQITYIKVYYVSSGGGSTPEPDPEPAVPHTVRFASGNDGWTMQDVTASASATAPAILQNVMAGDSLVVTGPTTLPGKVKSVKAVKFVQPTITVDGLVLNGQEGDSWETLAANNPEKLTIVGDNVEATETSATLTKQGNFVGKTATYSSSNTYQWLNTIIIGESYAVFYYHSGETWAEAINADRAINAGDLWEISEDYVNIWGGLNLLGNGNYVSGSSPIDPMTVYTVQDM